MPRQTSKLSAKAISTKPPGRHADGGGLYLLVKPSGGRSWVFRYALGGKRHDLGLGPAGNDPVAVTLAEARRKAIEMGGLVLKKIDPASERIAAREAHKAKAAQPARKTFREVAAEYIKAHESSWSNRHHRYQWRATLEQIAGPHFGDMPVADVRTEHVKAALLPVWHKTTDTAVRTRGRIEAVLGYATALGWRTGPNPAQWAGHLENLFPAPSKIAATEHHPSLPWSQVGSFMADLRKIGSPSAFALELLILTASRTQEVRMATWREIDWDGAIWTRPALHMKGKIEHRQPLSSAALAVLKKANDLATKASPDALIFPGQRRQGDQPGRAETGLSDMTLTMIVRRMNKTPEGSPLPWLDNDGVRPIVPHGFRATFRTWADDATAFDHATKEAAIAHIEGDKVVAAYARSDHFEKRRRLMEAWAEHCARSQPEVGNVVPLRTAVGG